MKEVKQCCDCGKWKLKTSCEEVALDGRYIPRYSSIEAHMQYETVWMCKDCIKNLN